MRSVRDGHAASVEALVARHPGWSTKRHDGYDGDLLLMVTPVLGASSSLVLSHDLVGFELGIIRVDEYEKLGCFDKLDQMMVALCRILVTDPRSDAA